MLGDVVSDGCALGCCVLCESVLGDCVLGDWVVLGVELSLGCVLGLCVLGLCVLGALESVPLVCAYTRPAATASATLVPVAISFSLLIDDSCLEVNGNLADVPRLLASKSRQSPCPSVHSYKVHRWRQRVRVFGSPSRASLANSFKRL
jgi:hypothetical protein